MLTDGLMHRRTNARKDGRTEIWTPISHPAISWCNKKQQFAYAKTKAQISCAVITAQLISAFVFAKQTVQFLFYLDAKFLASSLLLRLYMLVSNAKAHIMYVTQSLVVYLCGFFPICRNFFCKCSHLLCTEVPH